MSDINSITKKVYSEPTSSALRPYVIDYISFYVNQAKALPESELLHGAGNDIAGNICGALAWQGANSVEGEDWITHESEPVLYEILNLSSPLDVDANDLAQWQKLFAEVDKL